MVADEYDPTDGPTRVLLGTDTKTRAPVYLPYADRDLGVAIIGKAGTGKSSLLEHMILADLEKGTPGMVIDPHGLLAQRVMELATPRQADRIILLEALQTAPFGLNLLAVRKPTDDDDDPVMWAADSVVATAKKLYGEEDEYLPRLERYLDLAAYTLIPNGCTLADAPRLFRNDEFRRQCLRRVTDPGILEEWSDYDSLRNIDQVTHTEAVVNRLNRMLRPPLIQGIIGSRKTTVPFDQILNGDRMLLVSLPSERLTPERCDFIGALLLCALADRLFTRKAETKKPPRLHIYLDEYQRFATSTTSDLLEQGRKYGAGVTMAHQSLQQIRNSRIRDASRHAGALIVLGITRPDAEELAGEFPITPREEWVETVEQLDGTEPRLTFSPTPAEDIYMNGHSNPKVDLIARSFFRPAIPWTIQRIEEELGLTDPLYTNPNQDYRGLIQFDGDPRKSAGVPPQFGGKHVPVRVMLTAYDVNNLLVDAMNGKLQDVDAFLQRVLWAQTWTPIIRAGGIPCLVRDPGISSVYFYLANKSRSHIPQRTCDCPPIDHNATRGTERFTIGPDRPRRVGDPFGLHLADCTAYELTEKEEARNEEVKEVYFTDAQDIVNMAFKPLLEIYLHDQEALLADDITKEFDEAENIFAHMLWHNEWNDLFEWHGAVGTDERGGPTSIPKSHEQDLTGFTQDEAERWGYACMVVRARLRYLLILCEELYRDPVMTPTGEQQPRRRTSHIVHGSQTHADALNEFAGQLVQPPERYVAHVRQPREYHQVKLCAPLEGEADIGGRGPSPTQPDDIRSRSRALYDTSPDEGTIIRLPQPEQPEPRKVTRHPRPQNPEPEGRKSD